MKRDCNLELRLSESDPSPPQQLTIFYNGRISVCDITELQARAIITQASKETNHRGRNDGADENGYSSWDPISPTSPLETQLTASSGMSMKKSLERFLQKRKHRQLASSPYKGNR